MSQYATWYEFKKDLERHAGHSLLNAEWLRIKPAAPLPWGQSRLRSSLVRLELIEKREATGPRFAGAKLPGIRY